MGGLGSGTWIRWSAKETTESKRRIDIRRMKEHGQLKAGAIGSLAWSCNGKSSGSIC